LAEVLAISTFVSPVHVIEFYIQILRRNTWTHIYLQASVDFRR